jgi:alpha-tubulin suppressor-like RCC1 family protein
MVGTSLDAVKVLNVATSASSSHNVAITDKGVFVWGKNHRGQLGLGDEIQRNSPTAVPALRSETIVHAATGKAHTVFITAKGQVYAAGTMS